MNVIEVTHIRLLLGTSFASLTRDNYSIQKAFANPVTLDLLASPKSLQAAVGLPQHYLPCIASKIVHFLQPFMQYVSFTVNIYHYHGWKLYKVLDNYCTFYKKHASIIM